MSRRTDQRRAAVFALYQHDVTGRDIEDVLDRDASTFTRALTYAAEDYRGDLDEQIGRHAKGWSLDRIAPLERSILRVGLHEMLHRDDVPDEVAIDEAVEAAKEFCGAEAPRFVNGILGAAQRDRAVLR